MTLQTNIPFYAKASLIIIGLFVFISVLYLTQSIVVPIIYATIIAIVISPLVSFFIKKGFSRVLAIAISMVLVFIITILFALLLSSQLNLFKESLPKLIDKSYDTLNRIVAWASVNFNISTDKINKFISDTKIQILSAERSDIGSTLDSVGNMLIVMMIIPVYVFMILFYQPLLLEFIRKLFSESNHTEVNEVLSTTKKIIQRYLGALLLEAAIVATLNSTGLLIIGVDYAILLGIIGAILNVIPYIGGIIAFALPMIIAFTTKSSISYTILVAVVYMFIQFIDNHYIIPKIVASKVKLNALVSIIVVLAGGALWGIPGMFLSIPLTAILKVIFDHINSLKPWGFLLGDTMPVITIFKTQTKKGKQLLS